MDDLISRQAAIDIIEDFPHGDVWNVESMEEMIDRIKLLPSAEEESFEWCTGCKEYDQKKHCCHRWSKMIRKTVEEMQIVRCKDCKHRDPEDKKCDCGHDIEWQLPRDDYWYCADGERREDG